MAGKPRTRRIVLDDGEVLAGSAPTPRLVERFLAYIEHERGLSVNTRAAYRRDLADFTAWLGERAAVGLAGRSGVGIMVVRVYVSTAMAWLVRTGR